MGHKRIDQATIDEATKSIYRLSQSVMKKCYTIVMEEEKDPPILTKEEKRFILRFCNMMISDNVWKGTAARIRNQLRQTCIVWKIEEVRFIVISCQALRIKAEQEMGIDTDTDPSPNKNLH